MYKLFNGSINHNAYICILPGAFWKDENLSWINSFSVFHCIYMNKNMMQTQSNIKRQQTMDKNHLQSYKVLKLLELASQMKIWIHQGTFIMLHSCLIHLFFQHWFKDSTLNAPPSTKKYLFINSFTSLSLYFSKTLISGYIVEHNVNIYQIWVIILLLTHNEI